jgi:hypothetical protein
MIHRARNILATFTWLSLVLPLFASPRERKAAYFMCSPTEYRDALDSAFGSATQSDAASIVVRLLKPSQPESELVFEKRQNATGIVQRSLRTRIRSKLFRAAKPTATECRSLSHGIEVDTREVPIPTATIDNLLVSFSNIEFRGDECVRNKSGTCVDLIDTATYEVRAGLRRAKVTDTSGTPFISQNPQLLEWVLQLNDAVTNARGSRPHN